MYLFDDPAGFRRYATAPLFIHGSYTWPPKEHCPPGFPLLSTVVACASREDQVPWLLSLDGEALRKANRSKQLNNVYFEYSTLRMYHANHSGIIPDACVPLDWANHLPYYTERVLVTEPLWCSL